MSADKKAPPGGSGPPRGKRAQRPPGLITRSDRTIGFIQDHIKKWIGPVDLVIQEQVSHYVHIDLHHVKPGHGRPFHTLVTSGMSDRPMYPPAAAAADLYAELVLFLPADWPVNREAFRDENYSWPVREMKEIARYPHKHRTWLGCGHTIAPSDPPVPFAAGTRLCCWLLHHPISPPPKFGVLNAPDGRTIRFLAAIPLHIDELEYKLAAGKDALIDLFRHNGVRDIIDPTRPSVCRPI